MWLCRGVEGAGRGSPSSAHRQLLVAAVVDAHGVHDAKMRKRYVLAGAGTTEDVPAVAAMVAAVRECEGGAASHADVGIGPLGRLHLDQ